MADHTKIEWADATWSPVTGCTNISPGCDHCYAEKITNRFKRHPWGKVTLHPDRLAFPAKLKKPSKIFLCSMGDLFHSDVPWEFIIEVFEVMDHQPQHTFQVLTKRPGRMMHFGNVIWPKYRELSAKDAWPTNVWAGTSVETQKYAPRLDLLVQVPAVVRFVSYEPALGPVDLGPYFRWSDLDAMPLGLRGRMSAYALSNGINWVIAGGESGPGARPAHPEWFRSVRDQCHAAGVPFFFKQWGQFADPVGLSLGHPARTWKLIAPDGQILQGSTVLDNPDAAIMASVGKKAAGAILDGREWREFPA